MSAVQKGSAADLLDLIHGWASKDHKLASISAGTSGLLRALSDSGKEGERREIAAQPGKQIPGFKPFQPPHAPQCGSCLSSPSVCLRPFSWR